LALRGAERILLQLLLGADAPGAAMLPMLARRRRGRRPPSGATTPRRAKRWMPEGRRGRAANRAMWGAPIST